MTPGKSDYEHFDADVTLDGKRQGQVWASVDTLLDMIERERAGLNLFGQKVEMLNKPLNESRLQRTE